MRLVVRFAVVFAVALVFALGALAQSPTPVPSGSITAVVAPQGTDAIQQVTGVKPKTATLIRVDVCNADQASDHNVSTSRVISQIEVAQKFSIYGSDVVKAVLAVLQQKDVYTKAQKIISAGGNTIVLLTALFKTVNPVLAAGLSAAPQIAAAVLPAISDPRDFAALAEKIMPDNTPLALGRSGSGNDCHTGLSVAVSGTVVIASVAIQ